MELLTIREACKQLHVHPNTLRRWTDKGLIVGYRLMNQRRYNSEDVYNLVKRWN